MRVFHRFAKLPERQIAFAGGDIDFAQKPNSGNETLIPIKFDSSAQLLLGFVELSRVVVNPPEKHSIDCRKRLDLDRLPAMFDGLFVAPSAGVTPTEPVTRRGRPGVKRNGATELAFGTGSVPVVEKLAKSQRRVCLGKLRVQLHRPLRRGNGFRNRLDRWQVSVPTQQAVSVGEATHGQRVVGIFDQGELEVMQRLPQPNATLVPKETAFQIQLLSFSVRRLQLEDRLVTATRQAQLQRGHDRAGDVVLDSKHVLHLAVEPLRPEAETVGDVDELGSDAELGAHPAEAAFQHRLHTKGVSDLADVFVAAFERKARCPRRHTQPFDPRQTVHKTLAAPAPQTLVPKLLLPVGAHVSEGEHGDGSLLFPAGLARRSRRPPLARSRLPGFWPE